MKVSFGYVNQAFPAEFERTADGILLHGEDGQEEVRILDSTPPRITFLTRGKEITAFVAASGNKRWVHVNGTTYELERRANARPGTRSIEQGENSEMVTAPMPGQVRQVLVQVGERVQEGQPLVLLEAMKMEIRVTAPHGGNVTQLNVQQGQSVEREQILAQVKVGHDTR